jgi:hypothetical protein
LIAKIFEKAAIIVCFLAVYGFMGKFFHTTTRQKMLVGGKYFPVALVVEIERSFQLR